MLNATSSEPIRKIRVFVSSPDDVKAERELLDGVLEAINRTDGESGGFILQLVEREQNVNTEINPAIGQANDVQMPDCDVYLGILRTRFGTFTGDFGSGTEQEFRAVLKRFQVEGRPRISFCFYSGPVQLKNREEVELYDKVCAFRDELELNGPVKKYKKIRGNRDAFLEQVKNSLHILVRQLIDDPKKAGQLSDEALRNVPPPAAVDPAAVLPDTSAMTDIFLSYAEKDREVARKISKFFEDEGWSVWWDIKIPAGTTWRTELEEEIKKSRCMVVLWSANSINSEWVKEEAEEGRIQRKLVPILIESVKPPMGFRTIQAANLIGWNGSEDFPGLKQLLADLAKTVQQSPEAEKLRDDVTKGAPPPSPKIVVQEVFRPTLDLIGPSYSLDSNYYFLDWNPAFDALVAKPLGLARADHCVDFIKRLENCDQVVERSKTVFAPGKDPLVDVEELLFQSPSYGRVKFHKIAALMSDDKGNPLSWSVNLNIASAEKETDLWRDLAQALQDVANWSRYALSYDKLLMPFTDYNELLKLIVSQVGDARRCADLGAGTGNATLKLFEARSDREVWVIEANEMMLQHLRQKVGAYSKRLASIKDDVVRLGALRYQNNYFDAAIMINVLYAVQDPLECLRQACRILKPGGVLALSTPHRDTDVKKILAKLRADLECKGLFEPFAEEFETAKLVHEKMDHLIHRDTKDDIRGYLRDAGLEIQEWRDSEYVDSVVVVKAVKPSV